MFKINENTIIYVVCPYYNKTGGTELAHQLVYTINKFGGNAIIAYYGESNVEKKINPAFEIYVNSFVDICDIHDNEENIIVLPEIKPDLAQNMNKIQKCIWWMSVDNYLKQDGITGFLKYYGLLRTIRHILLGHVKLGGFKIDKDAIHLYQSEYAHQFLNKRKITKMYKLSDYINLEYVNDYVDEFDSKSRKNQVLYNPKKGFEFTKELINYSNDLKWIPIQNMTTQEVHELLKESKVYIDFGNHPGKDRFPREAAISGCCIITGKKGSAAYYDDVPIADCYKFDDSNENIPHIVNKIKECMEKYDTKIYDFSYYREFILNEYEIFEKDVQELFISSDGGK